MSDTNEPWKWGDESQPKPEPQSKILGQRHLCCGYDAEMRPFGQGDWVAYEDYKKVEDSLRHYIEQEALRKIGEDMQQPNSDKLEFIHRMDSLAIKKQKEVIETLQAQVDFYKKKLENETDYLVKIGLIDQVTHLKSENDKLKSEVQRLNVLLEQKRREWTLGLIEYERLVKAGDAMHRAIKVSDPALDWAIECWNAAKSGKQS